MKDILKTTAGVLLAAVIILGCWVSIRAWEIHKEKDVLTEIINIKPWIIPIEKQEIDALGRVSLYVGSSHDFEYAVVKITLEYNTYSIVKHINGEIIPTNFEEIYININDLCAYEGEKIYYQLNLEQLEHLEEIYYSIDRCKIR